MIRREDVDRIISAARIEDVVGDFVSLKKAGQNLKGLCPFHNEKTPSFTVSPAKGFYKCFGCGASGNSVGFLMALEHFSFPEALKYLAQKYGIDYSEDRDPDYEQKKSEEDELYFINEYAQKWFTSQLVETDLGKSIGLSYFRKRGFSDLTIKKFNLGYSPDQRDALYKKAIADGYREELLIKSGLSVAESKNDRFRGRVIFPIHSLSGKVIGFGGRTLLTEKTVAKYVNSPETPIYFKSKVLYGMHLAKGQIVKHDLCYLAEGYTDVISMHQAGIENVVASSGTSLTEDQIRLIRRFTANICVMYDGDSAGIKASFRAIDMLLSEGLNVKVVLFPDGEDPDSFSRKVSTTELRDYLTQNAADFILYKSQILLQESGNDPLKKAQAIREVVNSIALINDAIIRAQFISACSKQFSIEENVLVGEMNKILRIKLKDQLKKSGETYYEFEDVVPEKIIPQEKIPPTSNDLIKEYEKKLIHLTLNYASHNLIFKIKDEEGFDELKYIPLPIYIQQEIQKDGLDIEQEEMSMIFNTVLSLLEQQINPNHQEIIARTGQEYASMVFDFLSTQYLLSPNWEELHKLEIQSIENNEQMLTQEVGFRILELKALHLKRKMDLVLQTLKNEPNEEAQNKLLDQYKLLKEMQIDILKNILKRVIIS